MESVNEMNKYVEVQKKLLDSQSTWLITGVAGFIGSNLLESLLMLDQKVVGLDNFATGHKKNLEEVKATVGSKRWENFVFHNADIRNISDCYTACLGVDHVLHQAALGSVPRSLEDPANTNASNVTGFLNMLIASRDQKVKSFTYAASSSTYGDHPDLPKKEDIIGKPLSPYAVTKYVNELYADVFAKSYGFKTIGLRYFNVFGKRQDPNGAYAAVIPKWTASMINNKSVVVNGDGNTSRDFCFIENAVQANILAALADDVSKNEVYNVAVGEQTSLTELFEMLRFSLSQIGSVYDKEPEYQEFRRGDVRHSLADISKARDLLGFSPNFHVRDGINKAMPWYLKNV